MMERRRSLMCLLALCFLVSVASVVGGPAPGYAGGKEQVNINTATVEELVQLPRVGQKVAERIVLYRQKNGSFKTVEDLKTVQGVGDKVLEQIRPLVCVK